ncbi:MAG: glycosyltransferase [Candidatus Methanoperedens sp.]|nr:glycosyltransferase [Candidatus Methanoperedens sp.]
MKAVLFSYVFQLGWGVGLIARKHIEGLLNNHYHVCVATPDMPDVRGYDCQNTDLEIIKIGKDYSDVKDVMINFKPDFTIVYTPPYFEHIANITSIDTIKIAYDTGEPFPFLWDGIERKIREEVDIKKYSAWFPEYHAHVCISEFIKKYSGFKSSVVHYPGADHIELKESGRKDQVNEIAKPGSFVITSLSRIGEGEARYKGFDILIELKKRLKHAMPDGKFTFLLVGGLALGGDMVKKELENNEISVLNNVDEDLKRDILINSDLFFSPSLWEGFNLPLVEAQYLGVPTIALSTGAHPEVCPFHYATVDEVKSQIIALYEDSVYRKWCAQICKNYVHNSFKWENNVAQLIALLKDLLNRRQRGQLFTLCGNYDSELKTTQRNKLFIHQHLERIGLKGEVIESMNSFKINYKVHSHPLISIIIPNREHLDELQRCVSSIVQKSTYENYEIVIIENRSQDQKLFDYYVELKKCRQNVCVVEWDRPFNYSSANNYAVENSKGDYLIFLNNDTEVITDRWIEEMLMLCLRGDVGAVGAKLIYPNETIQHGGVILGLGGVAGHSHRGFPRHSPGYMKRLSIVQNLSAVTAACLMTKRRVFNEVGGFNERLAIAFNDVDFCLRLRGAGYLIVWTPFAELYHHEFTSRGQEDTDERRARFSREIKYMKDKWGMVLDNDPYYNPNLTREREDFSIRI